MFYFILHRLFASPELVTLIRLLACFFAVLCFGIWLTIFFSPRERAWRKWRRRIRRKYGEV